MNRTRLWASLRAALAAGILGYSGWRLMRAWDTIDPSALSLRPAPLLLGVGAGAGALLILAMTSALGARAAGLGISGKIFYIGWLRVWFHSYFFRYIPGKIALVVERARLGERLGVPRAASLVLVLWESLLLLAGAAALGGIGLSLWPARLTTGEEPVSRMAMLALAAIGLFGSISLWPLLGMAARRISWISDRLPGLLFEVSPLAQALLVLGNAAAWALLGLSFAAFARALSPVSSALPDTALLVTWFVVSYVGGQVASVTPAGLGVREGILVAGLSGVVPAPVVLAWAVAHRIGLSLIELALVVSTFALPLPESTDR